MVKEESISLLEKKKNMIIMILTKMVLSKYFFMLSETLVLLQYILFLGVGFLLFHSHTKYIICVYSSLPHSLTGLLTFIQHTITIDLLTN